MSWYYLNVTVHVLAALFWLGGMFFLAIVGAPVLRAVESPELRRMLFRRLGEQFRLAGWIAITLLVITGVLNLWFRGLLSGALQERAFWSTAYGTALAWKLGAVVAMLTNQALHDFVFGPRASRVAPGSQAHARTRTRASWLARANAVVGVVLVFAAVRLARGG
jgi:copper resistance protein D